MAAAIAQLQEWQQEFAALPYSQTLLRSLFDQLSMQVSPAQAEQIRLWAETRNLLTIGLLILNSAVFRTESRGGHYRSDYPETSPDWQVHTMVQGDGAAPNSGVCRWKAPVAAP